MKLRLPHKFQAALLAAIASVSFTTLSTGTITAAGFAFFGHQAFADDSAEDSVATIDIGDTNLDAQAAMDEEEEKTGEAKEPASTPINKAGFNGIIGSSDAADRILSATDSGDSIDTTRIAAEAAANQAVSTTGSGDATPATDLGFTTQVTDGTTSTDYTPVITETATQAAQAVQTAETSTQQTTTSTGTTATAKKSLLGTSGISLGSPVGISGGSPALAAPSTVGDAGQNTEPEVVVTTLTTTFGNANQDTATSVTTTSVIASQGELKTPSAAVTLLTQYTSNSEVKLQKNGTAGNDSSFLSPNNNVGNAQGWKLTLTYSGADAIQSITGMTLSVGLFDSNGAWQTSSASWTGNETFTATVTANNLSQTYTGVLFGDDENHNGKGSEKFAVTLTGAKLDLSSASEFTVAIAAPNGTMGSGCFMGLQNIGFDITTTSPDPPTPKEGTFHVYVLTGQSNSLGAVKGDPLSAELLAAYQSQNAKMWDANMGGSVTGGDNMETAWNNAGKTWINLQQSRTPGSNVAGTDWAGLTYPASLVSAWGGSLVMGPEYGFGYMLEKKGWFLEGDDGLGVIKASRDGGGDNNWEKGNKGYNTLLNSIKLALDEAEKQGYETVSLDGLMYLQGESNGSGGTGVQERYLALLSNLKQDLVDAGYDASKLTFDTNSVLGEIATWNQTDTSLGNDKNNTVQYQKALADSRADIGYVHTRDLDKITPGDGMGVHYNGEAQLTIGARYAYAFAVQNSIDVGTVRGDNDEVNLNEAGAWWMNQLPGQDAIVVWDLSSVSTPSSAAQLAGLGNNIAAGQTLTVGGVRIEDPYKQGVIINGGTLSTGTSGIELQGGDLSVSSDIEARATQTWNTVYTPTGGTQQNHQLTTSGTVDIASGATLTIAENSRWQFNVVQGTGSLVIGDGATLSMTEADLGQHAVGGSGYSDGNNGFLAGRFDLITLTGDGTIDVDVSSISKAGALADKNITLSSDQKVLQILNGESAIYHVRDGVVVYDTATGITDATSIDINDMGSAGATLELGTGLASGVTITSSGNGGAVKIDNGVSLAATSVNAAGAPVAITGSGTFVGKTSGTVGGLTPAEAFGTGVTLSSDWTGTVKIADTTISSGNVGIKMNDLGNANSTVEFEGVKAFLNASPTTYTPNIKLTGTGLEIDAGSTGGTYTFNGSVSGNGALKLSLSRGSDNLTYVFAGDVTNWNGEIQAPTSGKTITLKFTGDADTVNAKITKTGGTLNLLVANNATFGANVTGINNLTTLAGTRVAFNGETSSIDGTSSIGGTITNGGSMTLGGTIALTGSLVSDYEVYEKGSVEEYSGQGDYTGNGYLTTDSKFYLVKNATGGTLNNTATASDSNVSIFTTDNGSLVFQNTVEGNIYYVNGELNWGDDMGETRTTEVAVASDASLKLTQLASKDIVGTGTVKIDAGANTDYQYHDKSFLENFTGTVEVVSGKVQLGQQSNKFANATLKVSGGDIRGWSGNFSHDVLLNGGSIADAGNNETYSGKITLIADSKIGRSDGDKKLTFTGPITGAYTLSTLGKDNNASFDFNGATDIAGLALGAGTVNINNIAQVGSISGTGNVNVNANGSLSLTETSSFTGNMTVKNGSTLTLAGAEMLTVTGTLTLESGSTLDLARLFAAQEEPVQSAPLRVASSGSPQLLSSLGGSTSGLSVNGNPGNGNLTLLGAVTPTAGATYILATANSIGSVDGVLLQNIAEGYTGTLSTQDASGTKQLILTLASTGNDLIWDNHAGDNKWDIASTANWHADGQPDGSSTFAENDNVTFRSGAGTAQLQQAITAGTMTLESSANLTVNTNGNNLTVADLDTAGTTSLTKTGAGTATFGGSDAEGVTLNALSVTGGTAVFNEHVTVTGGSTIQPSNNANISFNDGLSFTTGGGQYGYAVIIASGSTVNLGGVTNVSAKNIGPASGATLTLAEGAEVTALGVRNSTTLTSNGSVVLNKDATLTTGANGVYATSLSLADGSTVNLGGDSQLQAVSGTGSIVAQSGASTVTMKGDIRGFTGTLDNTSSADVTLALEGSVGTANMGITHSGEGKVNVALNKDSVTLNGTQQVNNVTQSTNWSAFIGNAGDVTATGRVQTGRLVVGDTANDAGAVFTLSGSSAMMNKSGTTHSYDGAVKGYGTFVVADGATQTLTNLNAGDNAFHGTLKATGEDSVLTLSNTLGSGTDLYATEGGKIVLNSTVSGADTVTIDSNSTLTLGIKGTGALSVGSLTLGSASILDLSALGITGQETDSITLVKGGTIDSSNLDSVVLHFATEIHGGSLSVDANNNLVLTFAQEYNGLIWDNHQETGKWNTADNNWHTAEASSTHIAFSDGDNVRFTGTPANPSPTLDTDVHAGNMVVDSGVTVTVNTGANNLTVASLTGGDSATTGGTLVKQGNGTATINGTVNMNTITAAGGTTELAAEGSINTLTVNNGAAVQLASGADVTLTGNGSVAQGNITVGAGSELTIDNGGKLLVKGHSTMTISGGSVVANGTLQIGQKGSGDNTQQGYLTMTSGTFTSGQMITQYGNGASIEFQGGSVEFTTNNSTTSAITRGDAGEGDNVRFIGSTTDGLVLKAAQNWMVDRTTFAKSSSLDLGNFVVDEHNAGTITMKNAHSYTGNNTITNNATLVLDTFTIDNGESITLAGSGTTTLAGVESGTGSLTVSSGTLALTSTVTSIESALTVNSGGTLTLAGPSATVQVGGAFTLASGSTLNLSNYTFTGSETSFVLATTTGSGSIVDTGLDGVNLTFAQGFTPDDAHLEVLNGNTLVLTFGSPTPAKDLLWKGGDGTWVASTAVEDWYLDDGTQTPASFGNGDNVRFDSASSDATMTVSGSIIAGSVEVADDANVTLVTGNAGSLSATGGITVDGTLALDGTGITGTLSGDGVVVGNEIPSAANWSKSAVLGNLSLDAAGWTGTVEVGGGHKEFSAPYVVLNSINQLATENSTVRLKGVGGYFDGGDISVDIELVNPDDASPAVLITAGNNKTTTFSGNISGSGDLKFDKNGGSAETFKFTGDISLWNGSLTTGTQHTGALTVELADSADEVNAAIMQGGDRRALNLKVDNDATFNNTVKVNQVEIAGENSSATFMGDTEIATLAGAGTLVVDGANTTTIGSGNGFTGGIDLLGGTLDLTNALTGVGAVNLDAGTLKLAGGDTAALTSTGTITLGSNLTLDLSNYNSSLSPVEGGTTSVTLATATGTDGITGDAASVSLTGLTLEEGYKASLSVVDTTNLVLTVKDESEQLYWLDPSGTWTARNTWYNNDDQETRNTFQPGDSVTIVGNNYDGGISTTINMVADASARNMTVTKADDVSDATVTISDTVNENRLAAKTLVVDDDVTLVANTQLEVTGTAQLGTNSKLELNSKKDATIAAAISSEDNSASITKEGGNTLTLTGDNSGYTGSINVTAGTLAAQSEHALGGAAVTVSSGAELSLENRAAMNGASLTMENGSTITFLGDTELTLSGSLTLGDNVTWDLSRYGFDRPAEGQTTASATLITLSDPDGFDDNFGTGYVINTPGIVSNASLSYDDTTHSVILTYDMDSQGDLFWMGGVGNWNADSSNTTWYPSREGGQLTQFYKGDNVTFDNRAAVSPVTLTEDITAGKVTVENGTSVTLRGASDTTTLTAEQIDISGTLGTQVNVDAGTVNIQGTGTWNVSGDANREFAGEITGTGTLAKSSSGDLLLSGDNSAFTGEIQLNSGTITAAHADALGTGTTIAMANGTEVKGSGTIAAVNVNDNTFTTLANTTGTISADLTIDSGSELSFAGYGNMVVTGDISGTGTINQESYGVTTISDLNGFNGTIDIDHGTLALDSAYIGNDSTILNLGRGGTLQFASNVSGAQTVAPLTIGTLNMEAGTYLDVSNITLGSITMNGTTVDNAAVLAIVTTGTSAGFPHTQESGTGGTGTTDIRMIEGVVLTGTDNLGLDDSNVLRLRYGYQNNNLVVYVQTTKPDGKYWNDPDATGKWENTETPETKSWNYNEGGDQTKNTWYHSYFSGTVKADDAYFTKKYYDEQGNPISANIDLVGTNYQGHDRSIDYAGDIVFGKDAIYTLNGYSLSLALTPNGGYNDKEKNLVSTMLVEEGADVTLNASLVAGDGTFVHVKEGASFVINAQQGDTESGVNEPVSIAYGHNSGYMEINADGFDLSRYSNDGIMKVTHTQEVLMPGYPGDPFASTLETFTNMERGIATFSSDYLTPFPSFDASYDPYIYNDGKLYFNSVDDLQLNMHNRIAVRGRGEVYTGGERGVIFDVSSGYPAATVQAGMLELDAASSTFYYGVDITDSTTVKAGKNAYFYGGTGVGGPGGLGEVALEDASTITFGPRVEVNSWTGEPTGVTAQSYDMGHVTAGAESVLTVQKGATVTMDGYNAASGVPAGKIVVGTMPTDAPTGYAGTASLTIDGPAAVDTVRVLDGTATIKGNASINQIMQDGGVLTLKANSVLNGVPVSEGSETLTGGTVTGGTLALDSGTTLDQNAVITVGNSGSYTVSGEGSRIDATDLELQVDRDSTLYREVVVTPSGASISTTETQTQSGFMSSGDEYVKLFDMGTDSTLISSNEAVYHASASGMMTLIGTDNLEAIKESIGVSTFDVEGHIGYGYLHTADLALKTYYVRDAYASANQVTLKDIIDATADTEHPQGQLENVVFDITDYNDDDSLLYNGTLTVDENVAVDLFSVSADATAAINIASGTTVTADADSPGVQGQLDLQGAGVYEIQDRNDLGTNIGLRDDEDGEWNGTVRVTGTSTDLTLGDKYVGEGADASTIEFQNWDGALSGGTHEVDAQVKLTSTTEAPTAMKLTGEEDIAYTFTNTVSGGGDINHAEGGNVAMAFSGNTAGWTGTYEQLTATEDSLTFTGGTTVSAGVTSGNGSMDLTYGGSVETVAGDVNVYSGGDTPTTMNVAYAGGTMAVTGGITSDAQSSLNLTVGDGESRTAATFSGTFTGTENATMAVKGGSAATINTDAELQCVVGEEGSSVVVNNGSTLTLASTDPVTGYSEFHNLTNNGAIEMKASGGDIRLVDDTVSGNTFNLGNVALTDPVGTATIETSGVADGTTNVNISGLVGPKSADQVLELMNGNATGTVNYNLGNTDDTKDLDGTLAYGVNGGNGAVTNLVIQNNGNSAASAVLETRFASADDVATANIVVDAATAHVLGLSSDANSTANKTMVVSGSGDSQDANKALEITGDGEYVYAGKLGTKLDVAYSGDGSQTIQGGVDNFSGKVTVDNGSAQAGVLELLNASSVTITDLTIGANDTLDLNDGSNVGTAVVTGTMKAGGAGGTPSKLDGSLTLNDTAIYDVSASGGTGGLNLTGALTINEGAMLSAADMAIVWNMKVDEKYDLAFGVTAMSGFGDVDWTEGVDASTFFGNGMKEGEYYIRYSGTGKGGNGNNVGAVYLFRVAVPEPATSTLSLLALAALAARRRRK